MLFDLSHMTSSTPGSSGPSIVAEVVLPSGRFARLRTLTGRDYLSAQKMISEGVDSSLVFIVLGVTIDDKPVTYEEVLNMELCEVYNITSMVSKYLSTAFPRGQ